MRKLKPQTLIDLMVKNPWVSGEVFSNNQSNEKWDGQTLAAIAMCIALRKWFVENMYIWFVYIYIHIHTYIQILYIWWIMVTSIFLILYIYIHIVYIYIYISTWDPSSIPVHFVDACSVFVFSKAAASPAPPTQPAQPPGSAWMLRWFHMASQNPYRLMIRLEIW